MFNINLRKLPSQYLEFSVMYFYNTNANISKYHVTGNLFNVEYFSLRLLNTAFCFHDNHGSNVGVGFVSIADSIRETRHVIYTHLHPTFI